MTVAEAMRLLHRTSADVMNTAQGYCTGHEIIA
jgi:hypothetical protein